MIHERVISPATGRTASPRPSALTYAALWAVLAVVSLLAPWFVVFAVMAWIVLPATVLLLAGCVALSTTHRAAALAVAQGTALAFVFTAVPSVLVVWGAVAQMGDNYF